MHDSRSGIYFCSNLELDVLINSFKGNVFDIERIIHNKGDLFEVARDSLPQDPPLSVFSNNWDGLSDSLWGGLHELEDSRVLIVFRSIDFFVRESFFDFKVFYELMLSLIDGLIDERFVNNKKTFLTVCFVGVWSDGVLKKLVGR